MKNLQEAVNFFKCVCTQNPELKVLVELAEKFLSVGTVMPKEKEILDGEDIECFTANDINRACNETLKECILAATKMLAERESKQWENN